MTGGCGFVGSAIVRELLDAGADVRVLVRPTSDTRNIDGIDVERAVGDICDGESIRAALHGCDTLFHAAAFFTHWTREPLRLYDVNVRGTRTTLQAALDAGIEKVVYTSTNNAVGAYGATPSDERAQFNYWSTGDHYSISKYFAEVEAFKLGAKGLPLVVVNPTLVIGERDLRPTSSGELLLAVAAGRLPVYMDGWVNVVDVRDVARGHLLAARSGRTGERYLLGGENLTVGEYFRMIARAAGVDPPRYRAPRWTALAVAHWYELVSRLSGRHPAATVSEVRIGALGETYDCTKAVTELGFAQTPARECIQRSIDWFRANGYLS